MGKARGPLSDPPKQGRLGRAIAEGAPRDRGANPRVRLGKEKFGKRSRYPGISQDQRAIINQMEASDMALGDMGQAMMPGIQRNFETPFDQSGLPVSPWASAGDVKGMQDKYYQEVYDNYSREAEPEFQKQLLDFDASMVQRGIPMGSELYDKQKKNLIDAQEGQRQTMRTQALQGAGQYAGQWQDIQGQNYYGARDVANSERYRPLTEYSMLMGAQSGIAPAALAQSYERQNQAWALKNMPQGGGGGGGGGGAVPYGGFGSQQAYWDAQDQRNRANMEYEMQLKQKYGPQSPNPYASLAGNLGGAALGGLFQNLGKTGDIFGYSLW